MKHADGELVTISVGYACIIPNRNASPTDLIKTADQALYQAKQDGRNRTKSASILSLVQDTRSD
jgi:diguanylate cyclase (GGDEF)-like protein